MKRVLVKVTPLAHWFGWCASIAGLYMASGSGCPCCGRVACPVGVGGSGLLGALAAAYFSILRRRNGGFSGVD